MKTLPEKHFPDATRSAAHRLAAIPVRGATQDELPGTGCDGGGVFALQVLGESMLPEFEPGDIVVAEPEGRIDDGAFVIARSGDGWVLRQIRRDGATWRLAALNEPGPGEVLPDLSAVRGVVIQKSKPGRRRSIKRYD